MSKYKPSAFEGSYRRVAQEKIAEVLSWWSIQDCTEFQKMDSDTRKTIKKLLENNYPWEQRRGQKFRIWESECRILFGYEARKAPEPAEPVKDEPKQRDYFLLFESL